jgi:hypothetical protein
MRDPPGIVRAGRTTRTDNGSEEGREAAGPAVPREAGGRAAALREAGGDAAALRDEAGGRLPPEHPATAAASASTVSHLTPLRRAPGVRGSGGHAVRSGDRQGGGDGRLAEGVR